MKLWLLLCSVGLVLPVIGVMNARRSRTGHAEHLDRGDLRRHRPVAGRRDPVVPVHDRRVAERRRPWLRAYALMVSIAALIVSGYLSAWGMLAFRPWNF